MSDPGVNANVIRVLRERFALRELYPLQARIIARVMAGGDALVVMPTGSGKSLCYQLPALALPASGVTLMDLDRKKLLVRLGLAAATPPSGG